VLLAQVEARRRRTGGSAPRGVGRVGDRGDRTSIIGCPPAWTVPRPGASATIRRRSRRR